MQTYPIPDDLEGPCRTLPPLDATVRLFDLLTQFTHCEFDPQVTRRLVQDASSSKAEVDWVGMLRILGKSIGLRLQDMNWSLRDALNHATPQTPVFTLAMTPEGAKWVIIREKHWKSVDVLIVGGRSGSPHSERMSIAGLVELLGLSGVSAPGQFLIANPISSFSQLEDDVKHGEHQTGHGGGHGDEINPLSVWLKLLSFDRGEVWMIVAFAAAIGVLSLATPLAVDSLITFVMFRGLVWPILILSLILFVCLSLSASMTAIQTVIVETIQRRMFVRVSGDLAFRFSNVDMDAYAHVDGQDLANRFIAVSLIMKVTASLLLGAVGIGMQTVIGMIVLGIYHPFLLGFDLILLASIAFCMFWLARGSIRTSLAETYLKFDTLTWLEEIARAPRLFKTPGGSDLAWSRADSIARRYLNARSAHFRILMRQVVFLLALQVVASTALLGLGGWLVINDQLTIGQLVAAELIVAYIVASFSKMTKYLEGFYDLMAASVEVGQLLALPLERRDGEVPTRPDRPATLLLRQVVPPMALRPHDAHHHGNAHSPAISLAVASGERVALVGSGGVGKSVLLDLLAGYRSPVSGMIEYDGMDLRSVNLESLRDQIGLARDREIIAETVVENVRVGRSLGLGSVRESLAEVELLSEIYQLPDGLQTQLLRQGWPLSRSQAARLVLARAIVGGPRLLLIDGLLDEFDPELRYTIATRLFERGNPWTILLVSNDPRLRAMCDREVEIAGHHQGDHEVSKLLNGARGQEHWSARHHDTDDSHA